MKTELWRNYAMGVKTEVLGEKCVAVLLAHHKSHMDWPGIEPKH
jgi:hypothetical protein